MLALDTNTVIYFFKGMGRVAENLGKEAPRDIAIPAVVLYEIEVGMARSSRPRQRRESLDALLEHPSLTTWFGIATAALAILGNKFVELINQKLHEQLNIAERVAPYFGRRLYESYRILRS